MNIYLPAVVLYSVIHRSFQWLLMCVMSLFYTSVFWKIAVVQKGNVDGFPCKFSTLYTPAVALYIRLHIFDSCYSKTEFSVLYLIFIPLCSLSLYIRHSKPPDGRCITKPLYPGDIPEDCIAEQSRLSSFWS